MASACVNSIGLSPDSFLDCSPGKYQSFGWLSPRLSLSHELPEEEESKIVADKVSKKSRVVTDQNADGKGIEDLDPEVTGIDFVDFEFRLGDLETMLPADELFSDGKLMPLQISSSRQRLCSAPSDVNLAETPKFLRRSKISATDPYLFSPKAPRCSSHWKEILGLKKLYQNSNTKMEDRKTASALVSNQHNRSAAAKCLKQFLHRGARSSSTLHSSSDSSVNLPLLKDLDNESLSISSCLSLSSSSSSHDHDEIPRHSLDSDRTSTIPRNRNISRGRVAKHRASSSENPVGNRSNRNSVLSHRASESTAAGTPVSVAAMESPRMNSSGKIVFHGLERSSSSPSSFNGGSRYKYRGMERSYSANVRVTPVLNVPVCSLRVASKPVVFGLPMFSSHQKKHNGGGNRAQQSYSKNRTESSLKKTLQSSGTTS